MSDDPLIGTVLADRYRIDQLIGEGAMGRVYRAEHILMRKTVALKVLHPELMTVPEIVQRFEREARAAAQVEHPHVAGATDFGKLADGGIYLVLEFIEGLPLSQIIEGGPLAVGRVLNIAHQVTSALSAAHEKGIVHRDLKPDNLLLVQNAEEGDFIKVLDFGIAKVPPEPNEEEKPLTQVGMVYGTPEYMAPEQALGQDVDGRADLYALGVVMYEMLTGRRPYLGPAVGLLGQQLSTPLPQMSQVAKVKVPPAVEQLVCDLLTPDANKRPKDAAFFLSQLESLLKDLEEGRLELPRGALLSASGEDATTRIEHVSERARGPTKKSSAPVPRAVRGRASRAVLLVLLFAALGVGGVVVFVRVFLGEEKVPPEKTLELLEPPPPVLDIPVAEVDISPRLAVAREAGVEALQKLAQELPSEGRVHAELALALAKAKRYEEAVDSSRVALALDPNLNENSKIAGALFRSAQSPKASAATFRLLKGPMGPAGVGIIYDLARMDGISAWVRRQATMSLDEPDVRQAAGPALVLILDLESKTACEDVRPLVERAALVGDKRALPLLEKLKKADGCGARKKDDCYPCLRADDSLENAIQTIEQRTSFVDAPETPVAPEEPN